MSKYYLKDHVILFQFKLIFLKTRYLLYSADDHMTIFKSKPKS